MTVTMRRAPASVAAIWLAVLEVSACGPVQGVGRTQPPKRGGLLAAFFAPSAAAEPEPASVVPLGESALAATAGETRQAAAPPRASAGGLLAILFQSEEPGAPGATSSISWERASRDRAPRVAARVEPPSEGERAEVASESAAVVEGPVPTLHPPGSAPEIVPPAAETAEVASAPAPAAPAVKAPPAAESAVAARTAETTPAAVGSSVRTPAAGGVPVPSTPAEEGAPPAAQVIAEPLASVGDPVQKLRELAALRQHNGISEVDYLATRRQLVLEAVRREYPDDLPEK